MERNCTKQSTAIKKLALELGFTACGIAPAKYLEEDAQNLKVWLEKGMHAGMKYMENHFDKRTNPSLLVPGAKTVIVVLLNYFPKEKQKPDTYQIAKYAYGVDYHLVMKKMLKKFRDRINKEIVPVRGRCFVDSAPVLERKLASMAGLGWIGKNSNLISPKHGSFCFIGELIVDTELAFDNPLPNYCGSCNKCMISCPTRAIVRPGVIDSGKCISYWTIEHKGEINPRFKDTFRNNIFGCDICQDICPWNRKSESSLVPDFQPKEEFLELKKEDWQGLNEDDYKRLFRKTSLERTGVLGLKRNIAFIQKTRIK